MKLVQVRPIRKLPTEILAWRSRNCPPPPPKKSPSIWVLTSPISVCVTDRKPSRDWIAWARKFSSLAGCGGQAAETENGGAEISIGIVDEIGLHVAVDRHLRVGSEPEIEVGRGRGFEQARSAGAARPSRHPSWRLPARRARGSPPAAPPATCLHVSSSVSLFGDGSRRVARECPSVARGFAPGKPRPRETGPRPVQKTVTTP